MHCAGRDLPLDRRPTEVTATVLGRKATTEPHLAGVERDGLGRSTYCLDESPVLEKCGLILDVIARDPCLDLISEPL